MSGKTSESQNSYKDELDLWKLDIYTAASLGDVSFFVKYDFGKLKAQLSTPNSSGWTPLMYACARGHSLLVNYLLISGAKRDCKTKSGVTSLMLAITSGDLSTVESVFDYSTIEERDYRQWTPLFYAVHFTREKCLAYLLSKGADTNIVDFQNETPLMVAIKIGRETMVGLILQYATNLNVTSFKNESALMLANQSTNFKIKSMVMERYEYLKEMNLDNVLNYNQTTPVKNEFLLHYCSPTPLSIRKLKSQIKVGKSLTYSPNKTPQTSCQSPVSTGGNSIWKIALPKIFCSPQLKAHNDVQQFLKTLGLEKYWPIFRDEEVDFETLLTLNEENLKELGITLFGPRKKILLAIQELRMKN